MNHLTIIANRGRTLRSADDLVQAGLISPERAEAVAAVAARYAVALSPAVAGLIDRELLLPAEAQPFLLHHARAAARGDVGRAVARGRVDDHDLVDERQALEALIEHGGGVARDEDGGDRGARRVVQWKSSEVMSLQSQRPF